MVSYILWIFLLKIAWKEYINDQAMRSLDRVNCSKELLSPVQRQKNSSVKLYYQQFTVICYLKAIDLCVCITKALQSFHVSINSYIPREIWRQILSTY